MKNREVMLEGERVSKAYFFTLIAIGLAELTVGFFSGSLTLTTDGVDSLSDSVISLIVWEGLRFSKKAPDDRFHFGYFRVESLAALIAALGMVIVGTVFVYEAYLRIVNPHEIAYDYLVLPVLLVAGLISLHRALQMRRIARASNLLSLRTGAYNSIKDASASFIGFVTILLLVVLNLPILDAIGSLIIAAYIYTVAYISIRESSLVLVDAFNSPEVVDKIRETIGRYGIEVDRVRLRRVGPLIEGTIYLIAAGTATLDDVSEARMQLRKALAKEIEGLGRLTILFHTKNERDMIS